MYVIDLSSPEASPILKLCSEPEHVKYCIRSLLLTRAGERSPLSGIESTVPSFLFRQLRTSMIEAMKNEIERIIEKHEPRVLIQTIDIHQDKFEVQNLFLTIHYAMRSSENSDVLRIQIKG